MTVAFEPYIQQPFRCDTNPATITTVSGEQVDLVVVARLHERQGLEVVAFVDPR